MKVKSGEKVTELSKLYGVSDKAIYNWLRQKVEGSISLIEHSKVKKENDQIKNLKNEILQVCNFAYMLYRS